MTVGPFSIPQGAKKPDLLVLETTYCAERLPEREQLVSEFIDGVREVLDRDGRVLVPAFALVLKQACCDPI
jgi:Cft2 family RNA processing exonuclease